MKTHSSHLGREMRVMWAIAVKDMRTYYTRPPSIMFGILFPFSLFLSFSIGRNVPIAQMIPVLIAQTLFFASSSIGPVVIPMERRLDLRQVSHFTRLPASHPSRQDHSWGRLRHSNLHHPHTRRYSLLRIPDSRYRNLSRLHGPIISRLLSHGPSVRLDPRPDSRTGDDATQLRPYPLTLYQRRLHSREGFAVLGAGWVDAFTLDSYD